MMLVDRRAGSKDFVLPLQDAGVPVDATTLTFGDFAFTGRGERGADVWIGIEHKRFTEFLDAMKDGRLQGHQLPGLCQEFDRAYLVIEGEWAQDGFGRVVGPNQHNGHWSVYKQSPPALDVEQRVLTLELRGGLTIRQTQDRAASVRFLTALYRWWTSQDLDQHRSHIAVHAPDRDPGLLAPVSDFRRALTMLLPGIGLLGSRSIEAHFTGSLRRLLAAGEAEWAAIEIESARGSRRKLGRARAKRIVEVLAR